MESYSAPSRKKQQGDIQNPVNIEDAAFCENS